MCVSVCVRVRACVFVSAYKHAYKRTNAHKHETHSRGTQGTHGYSLAGYLKRDDTREESAQRRRDDRVPASGKALVGMPKWERALSGNA